MGPTPKKSGWRTLIDWRLTVDERREQVEGYHSLTWSKAARKQSAALLIFSISITFAMLPLKVVSLNDAVASLLVYAPLSVFMFRGHRWAFVVGILLWTLEKGVQLATHPGYVMTLAIWWILYVRTFCHALAVEMARRSLLTSSPSVAPGR